MDYTAGRRAMVMLVALSACGFDSGGDGNVSGDTSSSATTDPATTEPATSDPATSDPATTDPATTDPTTTDPATTDPTTDPTTTTDPATTDPTTTDPTTSTTEPSGTESSEGSTGGDDAAAYGPCEGNLCPDDQMCSFVVNQNQTVLGNSCREPCAQVADCPVPATGNPEILCPAPGYPWCVLGCTMGDCPDGMTCYDTEFGDLCYWDV